MENKTTNPIYLTKPRAEVEEILIRRIAEGEQIFTRMHKTGGMLLEIQEDHLIWSDLSCKYWRCF